MQLECPHHHLNAREPTWAGIQLTPRALNHPPVAPPTPATPIGSGAGKKKLARVEISPRNSCEGTERKLAGRQEKVDCGCFDQEIPGLTFLGPVQDFLDSKTSLHKL